MGHEQKKGSLLAGTTKERISVGLYISYDDNYRHICSVGQDKKQNICKAWFDNYLGCWPVLSCGYRRSQFAGKVSHRLGLRSCGLPCLQAGAPDRVSPEGRQLPAISLVYIRCKWKLSGLGGWCAVLEVA